MTRRNVRGESRWSNAPTTPETLADRFFEKVYKTDGCWIWTGAQNHLGYGQMSYKPRGKHAVAATHVSWFLAHGEWPQRGLDVCHECDNPPCVNPAHLFLGTAADNMRDAIAKGRFKFPTARRGAANHKSKLSAELVGDIRSAHLAGESVSSLSRRYGCAKSTLRDVVTGRNWRDPSVPVIPRGKTTAELRRIDTDTVREAIKAGQSPTAIARMVGLSPSRMTAILKQAGIRVVRRACGARPGEYEFGVPA